MVWKERDRFCGPLLDPGVSGRVPGSEATFSGRGEEEKE